MDSFYLGNTVYSNSDSSASSSGLISGDPDPEGDIVPVKIRYLP